MVIPDVNLLLYAQVSAFPEHTRARAWWEAALNGDAEVGLPAVSLLGFLRLSTNPRVFETPMSMADALSRVESWLGRARVRFLIPGPRHLEIAFRLLRALGTARDLTTDVQLAALAIENQAELHSNDSDFGRFAELRWFNPLA